MCHHRIFASGLARSGLSRQRAQPQTIGALAVETVASGLDHPWGSRSCRTRMLVTERLVSCASERARLSAGGRLPAVFARGSAGSSMSHGPRFRRNATIYFCYADQADNGGRTIMAARETFEDGSPRRLMCCDLPPKGPLHPGTWGSASSDAGQHIVPHHLRPFHATLHAHKSRQPYRQCRAVRTWVRAARNRSSEKRAYCRYLELGSPHAQGGRSSRRAADCGCTNMAPAVGEINIPDPARIPLAVISYGSNTVGKIGVERRGRNEAAVHYWIRRSAVRNGFYTGICSRIGGQSICLALKIGCWCAVSSRIARARGSLARRTSGAHPRCPADRRSLVAPPRQHRGRILRGTPANRDPLNNGNTRLGRAVLVFAADIQRGSSGAQDLADGFAGTS